MTFYTILFIRCNYKPRLELSITTLHDLNRRVDVLSLQLYTELSDIKRVIINTHAIESQALMDFFGTLSKDWALECMKELLSANLRANLQIVVQVDAVRIQRFISNTLNLQQRLLSLRKLNASQGSPISIQLSEQNLF